MNLEGLVELHVHTAPDVRPRSCDDLALAREAQRVGAKAVVLKSHHLPTADRALVAQTVVPAVRIFGGVALNASVGGLNPDAVEVSLRLGGKIVWLPTLSSVRHRRREGKSGGIAVVQEGRVVPQALEVFRQVAAADVILATGHQSAEDIPVIVAAAWAAGVRKVLINHPEHRVVGMSITAQQELLREYPVFFERCYAQPAPGTGTYDLNAAENLRAIGTLGPASTVLASDVGQLESPPWSRCWEQIFACYLERGVGEMELRQMAMVNPSRLLGI